MQARTIIVRAMLTVIFVLPFAWLAYAQEVLAQETKSPTIRDVTPPGVIRVYRTIEPTVIPESNPPNFFDIQVLPDGILRSGAKTIQLYGVTLPERKKLCTSSLGSRWTCGVAAYVALRNLVQSQSIACNILSENEKKVLGQCKVGQTDISVSLLQEGWAELAAGVNEKAYTDAVSSAKARGVGLWGNAPPERVDQPNKGIDAFKVGR
jgi:endonuclease YncB( thermonuclease family)